MTSPKKNPTRFGMACLGAGMIVAALPASAQEATSASVPERTLSSYLRSLAENPQSLSALMGAGRSALDLGDAQAALTFFGRAEDIAPRDGRIKMWMGSALVQLEQPSEALRFFDDAKNLGVPETDFARDRGLAYDLRGDPGRAQHDYALALKQGLDPEVTRRMALSLAISGKKGAALGLLEDQLKRQDRAAWRVRAFVLALTGDAEGANRAAQSAMPAAQAAAMAPFFARLPLLTMAERAMAVHFGRIAGERRTPIARAQPGQAPPDLAEVTGAGRPDGRQPPLGTPPASPTNKAANPADVPVSSSRRMAANGAAPRAAPLATNVPTQSVDPVAVHPVAQTPVEAPPRPTAVPPSAAVPAMNAPIADTRIAVATPSGPSPSPQAQTQVPAQAQAQVAPPPSSPPTELSMADIAAAIAALRDDPPAPPRPAAKSRPASAPAPRRTQSVSAAASSAKTNPAEMLAGARARHWVQVAGGAAKAALPREYARLKAKAPALLGKRVAWTTPLNATNRLLVGPFDSENEAQAFVNELAKSDVAAFSWTSPAGQEIERLPPK